MGEDYSFILPGSLTCCELCEEVTAYNDTEEVTDLSIRSNDGVLQFFQPTHSHNLY